MKALLLLAVTSTLSLTSCLETFKQTAGRYDYSVGTVSGGYFFTVSPKPIPPPVTSAKTAVNVRP